MPACLKSITSPCLYPEPKRRDASSCNLQNFTIEASYAALTFILVFFPQRTFFRISYESLLLLPHNPKAAKLVKSKTEVEGTGTGAAVAIPHDCVLRQ
jgi:hypothetical protein